MALKIRLARYGRKKQPYYWVVVVNSRSARDSGKVKEQVGTYNPLLPKDRKERLVLDHAKIEAWIAKGAQMTEKVAKLAKR